MFSIEQYNRSQEDFDQDRRWLVEELERYKQDLAKENDSDTLSCSEFDCIDDLREDEDSNRVSTTDNNNEHPETNFCSMSINNFKIDYNYLNESTEDQADNCYIHFPCEQKCFGSYENIGKQDESNLEDLEATGKSHTFYVTNSEFREQCEQEEVRNSVNEERSNGCDVRYCDNNDENCVDIGFIGDEPTTESYEETSACSNELNDYVESDDAPPNYCIDSGSDGREIEPVNISDIDQTQAKYHYSSSYNKDWTKDIKIIVIGTELKSAKEIRSLEKKQSNFTKISQISSNEEEPTDHSGLGPNDLQDAHIKHQTTQTCDILFRDKERSPADMFICEYCQKVFANQYKLDSHRYRNHHSRKESEESNIYVARQKSKPKPDVDWPPNIQKLARRVDGKKVFFCNLCSYSVDRCDSITKHMFRVHSNGRPVPQFQCEVCGKMFVDRAYLRNHKVSHITEKMHSCEVCGRAFHRQPSLKRHLQTHAVDRQYSCTLCDYQTNRKHMMYKHVENHKLGRAYICHLCHTHLYTQLAYRSHMYEHRVHPNSCSFCKVGFSSKERMMSHMRKAHSAYEINVYKNEPK